MAEEEKENEREIEYERDRPEAAPSFDISNDYQQAYLRSNYESDEYHELKELEEELDNIVKSVIMKLDNFHTLRPMKPEDLSEGQEVKINNEKKAKIVKQIPVPKNTPAIFQVKYNDGTLLEVPISSIEQSVDPVMKLKKPQLKELYEICYEEMKKSTKRSIDIVYYFYVFTEYFRINPPYMFACLSSKVQAILVDEVMKRTGGKMKKGINPIFLSSQQ